MTISLTLNHEDSILIEKYAKLNNLSLPELFHKSVIERIENEYDLEAYKNAMEEHMKNPVTYTLDEVEGEIGLE